MSNVNANLISAINLNLVAAINAVAAAKDLVEVQVAEQVYKKQYAALVAQYGQKAVLEAASTDDLVLLAQDYIQKLIQTKETIMSNTQTNTLTTTVQPAKKEGLMARMKAKAQAGGARTLEAARSANDAGKTYVMYVTDKFGNLLGVFEDTTEEGVMNNLKKYSKLGVYYTVYAVVAVPLYTSIFLTQFVLGLFGKSLDLAKMKKELETSGRLVKKGETTNP